MERQKQREAVLIQPPYTEQERAYLMATRRFGASAYTEYHVHYKLVGVKRGPQKPLFAVGDTWHEAAELLAVKMERAA